MILKHRTPPPEIFQLASLLKRIPPNHPQFPHWTEKLRRISAGYHGEQRVDSLWHEIDIPIPHYFIHDLFIQKPKSSHQMDTVLVTGRFVLILEIKSISGVLNFDSQTRQFSRTNKDGSIDGLRNPDDQIRRHEKWMAHFLEQHNLVLPVIGAIIFAYPSAIIASKAGNRILIQSSGLPYLLDELLSVHNEDALSKKSAKNLAAKLLRLHSTKPLAMPMLPASFLKGVLCPRCDGQILLYTRKKWRCGACLYADAHSHLSALAHYRHLVGLTITNREFRDFTSVSSIATSSKLLKSAQMPFQGSYKDRVYFIPEEIGALESISPPTDSI
ncbi:MAG TPA: nuclease-related domain-containing protein [Planococcus sp. (in: firmicutes)]|nr:nuclease-related domain-containing protein [Planococcus sp. (in: firmicutes)]